MIYVDSLKIYPKGTFCHMWTDGEDSDLHDFAQMIGVKKSWFHISYGISGRFAHYDLNPAEKTRALENGANFIALSEWLRPKIVEALRKNDLLSGADRETDI